MKSNIFTVFVYVNFLIYKVKQKQTGFLVGISLLNQKDEIKIVIQFTCLFGTPCTWSTNINIRKQGRTRALCREGTDMARVPCQKDTLFWKPLADDYYYNLISKILKIIYVLNKYGVFDSLKWRRHFRGNNFVWSFPF